MNDVLQEGALGFWEAVRDYDKSRGSSFRSFADTCTTRKIISAVRAGLRERQRHLNNAYSYDPLAEDDERPRYSLMPRGEDPEKTILSREGEEEIEKLARDRLSLRECACLALRAEGSSYSEIVDALKGTGSEIRVGKIKDVDNALQRAKIKMVGPLGRRASAPV
jgi:RNA polymerase sporulation-specific sigma factor